MTSHPPGDKPGLTGTTFGPYRIVSKLGEGGMGEVFRAHDSTLRRDVALKFFTGWSANDPANEDRLARFAREARALAALNHPHIAVIYGVETHVPDDAGSSPITALALELVEGETLADRIGRGPLPQGDAVRMAVQIAGALAAAHEKGIVHRDLKPANIKLTLAGVVKVLDFGLAKTIAEADPVPRRRSLSIAPIALAAAVLGGVAVWIARPGVSPTLVPAMRVEIVPSPSDPINVATTTSTLAISRDAARLAWASDASDAPAARGSGGPLIIRDIGELMPRRVAGAPLVRDPSFSPDGRWVLYYSGGPGLYKIPAAGGTRTTILPKVSAVRGASWTEDGTIVFATTDADTGLLRVSDNGGTPAVLTTPNQDVGETDHVLPSVLPDGRGILFTILDAAADNPRVAVLDARTQSQKVLIPGAVSAHYIDAGYLVYVASGTIFAVGFDLETLNVQGEPVTVATGVLMGTTVGAYYSVSRTGTLAYVPASATPTAPSTLVWVDRKGVETSLGGPARAYTDVRLAPDGQRVAVAIDDEQRDVWTWDLTRSALTRITADSAVDWAPTCTSDGKQLVFSRREGAASHVYRQSADGTGQAERLTTGYHTFRPHSTTTDGAYLIGNSSTPVPWTLFRLPLLERGPFESFQVSGPGSRFLPAVSPNNRFMAYAGNEGGNERGIYVRPFPDVNGGLWQVSSAPGNYPVWARDGGELFYLGAANRLTAVTADTSRAAFRHGAPVTLLSTSYGASFDVSLDGTRFLMIKEDPAARPPNTPIVLITNVVELLRPRR